MYNCQWAVVVPMANEEEGFDLFISELTAILDRLGTGAVFIVIDKVSNDRTLSLSQQLSGRDPRFHTVWAPDNKNVVEAYLRGFQEALDHGFEIIIEMDAGMSHDPKAIPMFLRVLNAGNECAFGSRYINGGPMFDSHLKRKALSRGGSMLANLLLGTRLADMTSGYQGFHAHVVKKLLGYQLRSTAHFYQTEVRYLLRRHRLMEVPIHYKAPSPRVSKSAIRNAWQTLLFYFLQRLSGQAVIIE